MRRKKQIPMGKQIVTVRSVDRDGYPELVAELGLLLESARRTAVRAVNSVMTATYWEVGRRIVEFEQGGKMRAGYGEQLIVRLADDLSARFGRGFSRQNLQQMRLFYLTWPAQTICQTPSGKSSKAPEIAGRFLLRRLEDFLLELGDDFAFIGRQRRLRVDDEWYRVDLLFFHRRLKSILIVDLKVGKLTHADAGQMHLYLNYAREHWMREGENPPVGLILCATKTAAVARYALEGLSNKVMAAEYRTVLPDAKRIEEELAKARQILESRR